jgi:hypothetical protein
MAKRLKQITAGILVTGLIFIGTTSYSMTYAANATTVDVSTSTETTYTLEEMLTDALEKEYMALAQYNAIMEQYGVQRPFSNHAQSKETNINVLLTLLENYNVNIATKDYDSIDNVPATLEEVYEIVLVQEEQTNEMYKNFLQQNLPDDVKEIFEQLAFVSDNHVRAFQNMISGNCTGYGRGYGSGYGSGYGRGNGNGFGRTMDGLGGCRGNLSGTTSADITY